MYLLDSDKTTVGVLSNRMPFSLPFFNDVQETSLDDFTNTLTFSVPSNHEKAIDLDTDKYILYPDIYGGYVLYKIMEVSEASSATEYAKEIYCEISAQDDLIKDIVRPSTFTDATLDEVMDYILSGSEWVTGSVDDFPAMSYSIDEHVTKLEALVTAVQAYGGEFRFDYRVNGTEIWSQNVDVFEKIGGSEAGKTFIYGKDIVGVERKEDSTKLVTALIAVGKADELGVPMSFNGANLTGVPNGYETGVDWVGSEKAQEAYSRKGEHIFGVYKDDDAKSPQELFENALKALQDAERPLMTYKVDVVLLERLAGYEHERAELGDTVLVQDKTVQPELYLSARIRKMSRSLTNPENDAVELGDYVALTPPVNKRLATLQAKINKAEVVWNRAEAIPAIQEKLEQVPTKEDLFSVPSNRLKVRYVRDWINGSSLNTANHWAELMVFKQGINIAKDRLLTTPAFTPINPENAKYVTDGIVTDSTVRILRGGSAPQYIQVDLGSVIEDVEYIQTWHYYSDARAYKNHYVDVSEDGLLWIRIYNSDKQGTHAESIDGFLVPVNSSAIIRQQQKEANEVVVAVDNLETFKLSAEATLQQKVDLVAYNTKVQALEQDIADKAGLEYVDGQLVSKADTATVESLTAEVAGKAGLTYVDGKLSGKAEATDVTALTAEVANKAGLTYVDGKLADKANVATTYTKTQVDTAVNGRVATATYTTDKNGIISRLDAHDTSITQTNAEVALKASQATVDDIEGRVETAEASLTVQAGQIATKVGQTAVDTGVATAKSYADTKDTANLTSAKTYADGKATTAENNAKTYSDGKLAPIITRVTTAETGITQTKADIALKASQTQVDTLSTTVAGKADNSALTALGTRVTNAEGSLTVANDAIAQRVLKTDYTTDKDGIISRLDTAEASITTQAGQIDLKAEQSTVDAIEGRVETAEASLSVQAGQISTKVTQTEVNAGVATAKSYADGKATTAETNAKAYAEKAIYKNTSAPATKATGDLWLNTAVTPNQLQRWSGTAWIKVTPTTAGEIGAYTKAETDTKATTAETNAKTYADGKINPLTTRVTTAETNITQTKTDIALKASQSSVDTVKTDLGNVVTRLNTAESSITQNASQIALKASQSVVDAVEGRMDTAEAQLTVQAGQIATRVTKEEVKALAKLENSINFRFIRYMGAGNSVDAQSNIVEIAVNNGDGLNVALSKTVTAGNTDATNLAYITNGITNDATKFASLGANLESQWAMIDLGEIKTDLSSIRIWHSWTVSTKLSYYSLQVSEDGINWLTLYDSNIDGTYAPTSTGFEIFVNQQKAIYSQASQIKETAEAISLKADADIVDDLGTRLQTAEQMITADAITATVTSSSSFVDALADKANKDSIDAKADTEELTTLKEELKSNYATKTELEQTSEAFNFNFSNSGGVNLVQNSVGFGGTDFWAVTGSIDILQNSELEAKGAGSGFGMKGTTLSQVVPVKAGMHTVSVLVKKLSAGTGYVKATYDNGKTKTISLVAGTALDYQMVSFNVEVEGSQIQLELQGTADSGIVYTSLMLNVGAIPLQWSNSSGEIYNANVQINGNGIKVSNSQYQGYTSITPEEFAGYYEVDGVSEKVFSLNKDTTIIAKAEIKQEINMSPMKIVPIVSDTLKGWAFVASDE